MQNTVDKIIQYESGEMSEEDVIEFFAELIKNKTAWSLQGHYGRTANDFIENGVINRSGDIVGDTPHDTQDDGFEDYQY